jgi:hypothetical protein
MHDREIVISETDRRPALYDCSLKEYCDMGLRERDWGEKCARAQMEMLGITRKAKNMAFQLSMRSVLPQQLLYHRHMIIIYNNKTHQQCHHHKHPGLGHLVRSVSRVTVVLSIVYSVSQLFSFLVGCSEMILKGFGFVAFFAGVKQCQIFQIKEL